MNENDINHKNLDLKRLLRVLNLGDYLLAKSSKIKVRVNLIFKSIILYSELKQK